MFTAMFRIKFNYCVKLIILVLWLTACGQEGPLYLPTDTPPIAVKPDVKINKQSEKKSSSTIEETFETPPNLIKEN